MFHRIILHIGRHKSGTSSLQNWLATQRPVLHEQGILYPHSGSNNRIAHHALAVELSPRQSEGKLLGELIDGIKEEYDGEHTLLLSSEGLQNIQNLCRVKDFIQAFSPREVLIICYMREHLDYAISAYRQMIHNQRRFVEFTPFCQSFSSMKPFFKRWRDLGTLDVSWYGRDRLLKGDIIYDFCNRTNIAPTDVLNIDRNPSIGGNLLAFKMICNNLDVFGGNYKHLSDLAANHKPFSEGFHIRDAAASSVRAASNYNVSLFEELGEIQLKSWSTAPVIPNLKTLEEDLDKIQGHLGVPITSSILDKLQVAGSWFALRET